MTANPFLRSPPGLLIAEFVARIMRAENCRASKRRRRGIVPGRFDTFQLRKSRLPGVTRQVELVVRLGQI
jgi:hypothetical protein